MRTATCLLMPLGSGAAADSLTPSIESRIAEASRVSRRDPAIPGMAGRHRNSCDTIHKPSDEICYGTARAGCDVARIKRGLIAMRQAKVITCIAESVSTRRLVARLLIVAGVLALPAIGRAADEPPLLPLTLFFS